jgi:hypothetical protein
MISPPAGLGFSCVWDTPRLSNCSLAADGERFLGRSVRSAHGGCDQILDRTQALSTVLAGGLGGVALARYLGPGDALGCRRAGTFKNIDRLSR